MYALVVLIEIKDFPDLQLDDADGDASTYTISLPIG